MAQQEKDTEHRDMTEDHANRIEKIELETKGIVAASKVWIYVIIALLVYMVFLLIPDIEEKVIWMEKDLSAVLVQSERYKKATRVFARDNMCATCHLSPDHLLHNLQSKYPSFSDVKSFMRVGHERYFTMTTQIPDEELMNIYRTLK